MMKMRVELLVLGLSIAVLMGASCPKSGQEVESGVVVGADAVFSQAEQYFEAGDYEAALKLYQQVVEDYPLSRLTDDAQFRMGQCYFKMGKSEEALSEFRLYVENNRDKSQVTVAQDYIARILENDIQKTVSDYEDLIAGVEAQNFKLEMLNRYLRRSVDSEVIFLELDLEADRLFVRLGTQTLYEYPIVSGKGRRRLGESDRVKDFSTPKGIRQVESILKDPVWYRPDWVWLERGEEIPEELTMEDRAVPGVLGPYKVSIGEGYYIHGTRRGKIRAGKYSHGCVRMNNDDLRQMVRLIERGTIVYIY